MVSLLTSPCGNFTSKHVTIIKDPGHRDLIKNISADISQDGCAVLIVAASAAKSQAGIPKNGQTCEDALLTYILGVKQLIAGTNKMDSNKSPYSKKNYEDIKEVSTSLRKLVTTLTR